MLHPHRYFDPDPATRKIAIDLYTQVESLPLVCPHGHVEPALLAGNARFPDPATLLVIPDHYVTRMLYSQGIALERLGIPTRDGTPVETDPRRIWQLFADHFHLYRGTPTGGWLKHEFEGVFGITEPLNGANAMAIYDHLDACLSQPEYLPRALYERFGIEVLCTTDAAGDTLEHHKAMRDEGWGNVRPTFRPDMAVTLSHPSWHAEIDRIGALTGESMSTYASFIRGLESRRAAFKALGATATDHAVVVPYTERLDDGEAGALYERALAGRASQADSDRFGAHMLMELARMSVEDGLVMQLHPGSFRNHNTRIFDRFGPDRGCDIPLATEYTRNLHALLDACGNEPGFTLVLFTLDETTYSRELAPLAGHYPAVVLGPPWWFHDSVEGMLRFRHMATETAGFYNTAGFNDDTRAFPSIPARHDVARRVDATFLAQLVTRHVIDESEAHDVIGELATGLVRRVYRLGD
ncbi:MAG: glucuronate isomerase [Acidobacteria bacterium]|nr:glucuronate isomerase [Acidobacteriota bacterium]